MSLPPFGDTIADFNRTVAEEVPRLPLATFLKTYLPLLASHFSGNRVSLQPWIDVAERATQAVFITNPDGSTAFIVPPLLAPTETKPGAGGKFSAVEVMTRANDLFRLMPDKGNKFLEDNLKFFAPEPIDVNDHRKCWSDIFSSYGYNVAMGGDDSGNGKETNVTVGTVDYDLEEL